MLGDLPGFGNKPKFGGFDEFEEEQQNVSNAEKFLEDYENEEREGFKVEVKRPGKNTKTSSGKKS